MQGSLRLFVAAYPLRETAIALLGEFAQFDLPRHRATPPEQVHLTFQFVGDTLRRDLDEVAESVSRACAAVAPFNLCATTIETLPLAGPSRLVAALCKDSTEAIELHRRLASRLSHRARKDKDFFRPHLTLCRFVSPSSFCCRQALVQERPFEVRSIYLMASILRPEGAAHTIVEKFDLG